MKELQDTMRPILFFCFILVQCSSAKLSIKIPGESDNKNVKLTVDLINYCYPSHNTIGLVGEAVNFPISRNEKNKYLFLNRAAKINTKSPRRIPHHADVYVVSESSLQKLAEVMDKLKESPWWRPDKLYVLTSTRPMNDSDGFFKFFSEISVKGVVNGIFIHNDMENNRPSIFTYNKFSATAPKPWEYLKRKTFGLDHPWTLFKQPYELNRNVCNSLLFDRMSNLTNYPMRVASADHKPYVWITITPDGKAVHNMLGLDTWLIQLIGDHMNLNTSIINVYSKSHDMNDQLGMMFFEYFNLQDVVIPSVYCDYQRGFERTYPIFWTGITSATRRKEMSPLKKILIFMPPYIIALLTITGIITVLGLFYVFKDWDNSLISVVQLILSQSIPRTPVTTPGRLFIIMVFVLYMITNSVFQGNVVKLLTVPRDDFNVEKLDDIEKLGYHVVTNAYVKNYLRGRIPKIMGEVDLDDEYKFSMGVDEAYVDDELRIRTMLNQIFHIPQKHFFSVCRNYITRRDWPILPKFNELLKRIFETGLMDYRRDYVLRNVKNPNERRPPPLPHHRALRLDELSFAFYVLLIGLSYSTIVFIIEILTAKVKRRRRR